MRYSSTQEVPRQPADSRLSLTRQNGSITAAGAPAEYCGRMFEASLGKPRHSVKDHGMRDFQSTCQYRAVSQGGHLGRVNVPVSSTRTGSRPARRGGDAPHAAGQTEIPNPPPIRHFVEFLRRAGKSSSPSISNLISRHFLRIRAHGCRVLYHHFAVQGQTMSC